MHLVWINLPPNVTILLINTANKMSLIGHQNFLKNQVKCQSFEQLFVDDTLLGSHHIICSLQPDYWYTLVVDEQHYVDYSLFRAQKNLIQNDELCCQTIC